MCGQDRESCAHSVTPGRTSKTAPTCLKDLPELCLSLSVSVSLSDVRSTWPVAVSEGLPQENESELWKETGGQKRRVSRLRVLRIG